MLQSREADWLNGYKNKTHIYTAYKKPTSELKTYIDWKWEDGKIYSMKIVRKKKKAGVAILISDKVKESEVAQSCPTLCDPMDCSPPGSSVHGIL